MRWVLTQHCSWRRLTRHSSGKTSASFLSVRYANSTASPAYPSEEAPPAKQQIVCSRSFGERITDKDAMHQGCCSVCRAGRRETTWGASVLPAGDDICTDITLCSKKNPVTAMPLWKSFHCPHRTAGTLLPPHAEP